MSIVVNKRDNGDAILRTSIKVDSRGTTLTALVLSEDPDGGTSGTVVYQWQICEGDRAGCLPGTSWMDIDGAIGTPYIISSSSVLVGGDIWGC